MKLLDGLIVKIWMDVDTFPGDYSIFTVHHFGDNRAPFPSYLKWRENVIDKFK